MAVRGIYFVGNDRVFDSVVAFLNSLRAHNPQIPLCFIPYDPDTLRIEALAEIHRFSVFRDRDALAQCDRISARFHRGVCGHYRKLAAWSGEFEEFVYIDVDTLVLRSVDFLFPLLRDYDVVTALSNEPSSRRFVWKDSTVPTADLTQEEIDFAANTGLILSRKGLFTAEQLETIAARAVAHAPNMELLCFEQPFLNYVLVKSTSRYTSIFRLNQQTPQSPLPCECWGGDDAWRIGLDGTASYHGRPRDVLLIHWSGVMSPRPWEKRLYATLRRLGLPTPSIRLGLNHGRLWRHYRNLRYSAASRLGGATGTSPLAPPVRRVEESPRP